MVRIEEEEHKKDCERKREGSHYVSVPQMHFKPECEKIVRSPQDLVAMSYTGIAEDDRPRGMRGIALKNQRGSRLPLRSRGELWSP